MEGQQSLNFELFDNSDDNNKQRIKQLAEIDKYEQASNEQPFKLSKQSEIDMDTYVNHEMLSSLIEQNNTVCMTHPDERGLTLQIGIDEAGRGPLLGSVVVGAVILPPELTGELTTLDLSDTRLAKLNDSKKISEKKRDELFGVIPNIALAYSLIDVPAIMIDKMNILQASLYGMRLAMEQLLIELSKSEMLNQLNCKITVLCDGNKLPEVDKTLWKTLGFLDHNISMDAVVKGDSKYSSIASASVMAKVSRDKQMYEMSKTYPEYGIDRHKGYPTKGHMQAIEQYGVLPEHRRSFAPVRRVLEVNEKP